MPMRCLKVQLDAGEIVAVGSELNRPRVKLSRRAPTAPTRCEAKSYQQCVRVGCIEHAPLHHEGW